MAVRYMVKKTCVIDAADCIGYFTSLRLALSGFDVVAISTDEIKLAKLLQHPNIQIRSVPNYSMDHLTPLLKDVQICCVNRSGWKPQLDFVKNIMDAAKYAAVSHIVYVSGMGFKSDLMDPYGAEQREVEYLVANTNIGWTLIHHHFLMQYLLLCINHGPESFCFPSGDAKVSFVDARDVAAAVTEIMISGFHNHGKNFTITGPASYTLKQCTDILSKVTGVTIESGQCNKDLLESIAVKKGVDKKLAEYIVKWSTFAQAGGAVEVNDTIEEVSGIEPTTFEDFVRDYANEVRFVLSEGRMPEEMRYVD
jgi:uncharacterized protein YbjT (DUF2867 family)